MSVIGSGRQAEGELYTWARVSPKRAFFLPDRLEDRRAGPGDKRQRKKKSGEDRGG